MAGRKTAWNTAYGSFSHTNINTALCKHRQVSMTLYLHHILEFFFMTRSVRRIWFQQKCNSFELDELFMNINWEVQAFSCSYNHNSWCIHPQELLCAGRVGWIWGRSSIELSLFWPLVKPYFWHRFQSIKFPLHFFFYWSWSLDSLKIRVSDFCFLEERRYLFKSLRPDIPTIGIFLS